MAERVTVETNLAETRRRINWMNVSIDTKVLVGRCGERGVIMSQRAPLDLMCGMLLRG